MCRIISTLSDLMGQCFDLRTWTPSSTGWKGTFQLTHAPPHAQLGLEREKELSDQSAAQHSINQAHTNALDQLRSLYNSQFPSIEGVGHIAEILVLYPFLLHIA